MNIPDPTTGSPASIAALRACNDALRASLAGGSVMLTPGIISLGAANVARVIEGVRRFDDFADDDPADAHDIGDLEVDLEEPGIARWRELIFFRIHHLALPGTDAPSLVMTLMLASEW